MEDIVSQKTQRDGDRRRKYRRTCSQPKIYPTTNERFRGFGNGDTRFGDFASNNLQIWLFG
jgi:hypothetical protein